MVFALKKERKKDGSKCGKNKGNSEQGAGSRFWAFATKFYTRFNATEYRLNRLSAIS